MASVGTKLSDGRLGRHRAGVVVAAFGIALFAVYLVLWLGLPGSFRTGNDFAPTYVAGRLILEGHGSDIYDEARIVAMERAAAPVNYAIDLPYISPPAAALAEAPLTGLSFSAAEILWSSLQLAATVGAAVLIFLTVSWPDGTPRAFRLAVGAAAVGAPTVGALLLFGEFDGLFTLGLAVGYVFFARRQPMAAGVAFGLAAGFAKPHLLVGVIVFLIFGREFRTVAATLITAASVNLAAVALLGIATAPSFVSAVLHSGIDHPPSGLVGAAGLSASWFGNGTIVRVVGLLLATLLFVVCGRLGLLSTRQPRDTPQLFAGALAVGLLASPHLLVPDMVVLVPAFIWLMPCLLPRSREGGSVTKAEALLWTAWVWIAIATLRDAANASVGFPGRLMPWGLVLFAAAAWLGTPGSTTDVPAVKKHARDRMTHA